MPATTATRIQRRARRARVYPSGERAYRAPGATQWSDEPMLLEPVQLLRSFKAHPQFCNELTERTRVAYEGGRKRGEGSYALLYLAFVCSGIVDIKTFRDRWASSGVWAEAGFLLWKPNYRTLWLRFTELEDYAHVFEEVARKLIEQARRHEARIGRHLHIDGSGFTTHAKAIHCCPDRDGCRQRRMRVPGELRKAHQEVIEAARHSASGEAEDESADVELGVEFLDRSDPRLASIDPAVRLRYQWVLQRGHIFRLADRSAGIRGYKRGPRSWDYWVGGHFLAVSDDFLQLPVAVHCQSASKMEYRDYDHLYDKAEAAVGRSVTMTVDRGFHVRSVFEHNLSKGTSTICEWRQPRAGIWPEDLECEAFDRDGVPRCRHCGDVTHTDGAGLGLHHDQRGNSYLLVRCEGRHTTDCERPQRVPCSLEPRLLQPINRTHKVFWDLYQAHKNKEGMFLHFRWRYQVAGNDFAERPKRRQSVPVQQLRASAGMLLDWLRACLKHGWLASARRPLDEDGVKKRTSGRGMWRAVIQRRDATGLWVPYGQAARDLGLAPDELAPSQRAGP
jgi:hypothetical protein